MQIGVIYPQTELGGDPAAVRAIGLATEQLGFDHLVTYDHVVGAPHDREPKLWGPYTEKHPFHDPFVMFAYLAGITTRIELVTGILILPQRQTVLVARQAADLDLLSNERFRMCVGIGWNYVEYDALGQDFAVRGKRSEEQVALLRKLWDGGVISFDGEFDRVDRAALVPPPKRQIPLWLGGFADVALRRAARIADGFIFADGAGDAFAETPKLLDYVRAERGSTEGFGLHINMLKPKTVEAAVDTLQRWRDLGGSHASINTMGMGFTTADDHIGYVAKVREAATAAGL